MSELGCAGVRCRIARLGACEDVRNGIKLVFATQIREQFQCLVERFKRTGIWAIDLVDHDDRANASGERFSST